ncbi:MAG: type VI secretion system baseplate subunit TssE [Acidobacteriaceae bacterium]|nr:type VI secretion system baseplate subunit TssE [Acidobacteriaceae bacterium]MBV9498078.1 type VI secretion system baseplate subunit TssE [Acidobacteriaceae bacterium]
MQRSRGDAPIGLSVLDRLIDPELKIPGPPLSRSRSLQKLRDAVRRDLEWLLNTRQPIEVAAEGSQLQHSLYMYGLPDITSRSAKDNRDRQFLTQSIETAIAQFEPRLMNVRVTLIDNETEKMPLLRFAIDGLLRVDPNPEHVSFDTLLQLSSGECTVRGQAGAR